MALLNKCCACIELRTGCLIIGYLSLISDVVKIIQGALVIAAGGVVATMGNGEDDKEVAAILMIIGIISLILNVLSFIFTTCLLVGVHQNKRGPIKAYLLYTWIALVLWGIRFICQLVVKDRAIDSTCWSAIDILSGIYFVLVVHSHLSSMDQVINPPINGQRSFNHQNTPNYPQSNHTHQNTPIYPQINYNHQTPPIYPQNNYNHQTTPIYPQINYNHQNVPSYSQINKHQL